MMLRESVIQFTKKHKKCTCQLCRKAITSPQFVCQNCFNELAVIPFVTFKVEKENHLRQVRELTKMKIEQVTVGKDPSVYSSLMSRRAKVKALEEGLERMRKRRQGLDQEKMGIQQFVVKREKRMKQLLQVVLGMEMQAKQQEEEYLSLQNFRREKMGNLRELKERLIDQFHSLDTLQDVGKSMQEIKTVRKEIPMIGEEISEMIIIDRFKFETGDTSLEKKVKEATKTLIIKLHLARNITGITLPYLTAITPEGELALGSRVVSNVSKSPIREEVYSLLQTDIDYLYSVGGMEKQRDFSLTSHDLRRLLDSSRGFQETAKDWRSYWQQNRLHIIGGDKEICENMDEDGEIVEIEDLQHVYSVHSSEEETDTI